MRGVRSGTGGRSLKSNPWGLTGAQVRTMQTLANARTYAAAGDVLCVTASTIKQHVVKVRKAMGNLGLYQALQEFAAAETLHGPYAVTDDVDAKPSTAQGMQPRRFAELLAAR